MRCAPLCGRTAEIAVTLNPYPVRAVGHREEDHDAARRVDGVANRLWYDAVLEGRYPDDVLDDFASVSDLAHVHDGDLAQIARPIDAVGINYYRRHHVRHRPGASASGAAAQWPGSPDVELVTPEGSHTDGGWAIEPDGLREVLERIAADHGPVPLYVHESGCAFHDELGPDGAVADQRRIAYLDAHLRAAQTPSPRASTYVASSSGRCWTTSSGQRATPIVSASSTSGSRRGRGCPKRAPTGTSR